METGDAANAPSLFSEELRSCLGCGQHWASIVTAYYMLPSTRRNYLGNDDCATNTSTCELCFTSSAKQKPQWMIMVHDADRQNELKGAVSEQNKVPNTFSPKSRTISWVLLANLKRSSRRPRRRSAQAELPDQMAHLLVLTDHRSPQNAHH